MLKRSIIIASVILAISLAIGFPVCRGRILSTKLVEAVEQKNGDLVENLLDKGANPNTKEDKYGTPLLILAVSNGSKKITQLLLTKGADPDVKLPGTLFPELAGKTTLHFERDPEIIELLLAKGANINARDNEGVTPLHMAAQLGRVDTIRALLERGAQVDARENRRGRTPLFEAAISAEPETLEQLILYGADVDSSDKFNCTPLFWAVLASACKKPESAGENPVYGADVNKENYNHAADSRPSYLERRIKVVQLLLDNGADVNAKNAHDKTALYSASERGHRCVVEMLLNYGADVNAKNDEGKTPLDTATKEGHIEIVKLLAEHGAKTSAELDESGR